MSETTSYRYWAFVSYSHHDKSWARWLHKEIETYAIPSQMVGRATPIGDIAPKRFRPLFYDRAELPASSDLGTQIEEALHDSRYLIVVCSPHAVQSKWVNKEIETFLQKGRGDRVLAVIVNGEPNSGNEQECFPEALRQTEPVAADARPEGDGKKNAKLKILAGMLGVGFDGLSQRDSRRRIRRLQRLMVVFLIGIVGLASLALYSEYQRKKAVKARNQAELILEYLLFDLRDELEPVGRLDIVENIQKRVEAYYQELGIEKWDPNIQRNQAVAFLNKGTRLMPQGDLVGSIREYRNAMTIIQQLVLSDPENLVWQADLYVCHNKLGDVLFHQGNWKDALQEFEASLRVSENLAAIDPGNILWLQYMSIARIKRGDVCLDQKDFEAGLQEFRASLQLRERVALSDPENADWQWDLTVSRSRIAGALWVNGDLAGALREYQANLKHEEDLAASNPYNASWQWDLSVGHRKIGDVLKALGDMVGSLKEFEACLEIIKGLVSSDPSNVEWQDDLSVIYWRIGGILEGQEDFGGALRAYQGCLQSEERLSASQPDNAEWQRDVFISRFKIGNVLQRQGDSSGAMIWWQKAYEQVSDMRLRGTMFPGDETRLLELEQKIGH